jgi:hypothetical protein
LYRPLTIASYWLNRVLGGLVPSDFHMVNIAIHAMASALVVLLIDALFFDVALALITGLLFAVHPIHVEAVTGIVGRAELMSVAFLLAALCLHVRGYKAWDRGPSVWKPASGLLFFCALLSKETAIVGPALLLLCDLTVQGRDRAASKEASTGSIKSTPQWNLRSPLVAVAVWVAIAAAYLALRYSVVGQMLQESPGPSYLLLIGQPTTTRILTALSIVVIYARLLFFPLTLSADYSFDQIPLVTSLNPQAGLGTALIVAFFLALAVALLRRSLPSIFALASFAIAYALFSNFLIPLGIMVAERVMYLPSIGFCLGVAWAGLTTARRVGVYPSADLARSPAVWVLVLVVGLLGARTVVRNQDWENAATLYFASVKASPNSHLARFNYSAILLKQEGRQEEALVHLQEAFRIRGDHYPTWLNLGAAYLRVDRPSKAREIALHGLQHRPDDERLIRLLGTAESRQR